MASPALSSEIMSGSGGCADGLFPFDGNLENVAGFDVFRPGYETIFFGAPMTSTFVFLAGIDSFSNCGRQN